MSSAALKRAEALLERGDVAGAEKALSAAFPDSANAPAGAFYLFGLIRRAQRRFDEAVQHLRRAVRLDASAACNHFALGDLLAALGDAGSGADALAEAVRLDPDLPNARRAFARAALNAERFEAAEAAARALIAAKPDADGFDILSCALRGQERLAEAAAAAEVALQLEPQSVSARHDWAVAVGRLGRVEEAVAAFEGLRLEGVRAGALAVNHAAALIELDRAAEAEALLSEAVAAQPNDLNAQVALAKARWLGGAGAEFSASFEDAIARNPNASTFRAACVDVLRAAGFIERAEGMLQKGLQRRAGDPVLRDALGALLEDADRVEEALPHVERAAKAHPEKEESQARYVRTLLRLGRGDEALAWVAPFRAKAPLNQHWLALESLALRQLGDPRYQWLCDYELMVQAYELAPPAGFGDVAAFNAALSEALGKLHGGRAHPLDQTLRHGTQTARSLRQSTAPVVRAYLDALRAPIADYIGLMRNSEHPWSGRKSGDFALSGAWSVRLRPNGYHVNHIHTAGWISSSYYVALPEGVAASESQEGWIKFGEPPKPMPGCGIEKVVQPRVGTLVLFPSYMWHGTIPISSGERLTAPFDVVPV